MNSNFKKDKNGFTLIELLAVIVIIGIIAVISITSYKSIHKNILQKDYENLVSYIKTNAEKYMSDNGILSVSVDTLIKEGYILPDNDSDILLNPTDNTKLNCYVIDGKYLDGEFSLKLSDKPYEDGKKCILPSPTQILKICRLTEKGTCDNNNNDNWYNDNFRLGVVGKDGLALNGNGYNFEWHSNTGAEGTNSTIEVNITGYGKVTYDVAIHDKKDGTLVGNAHKLIKVDKENPRIIDIEIPQKKWTKKANVSVKAIDLGSGIGGYYFGPTDDNSSCPTSPESYSKESINEYDEVGQYYACVIDNAGNISSKFSFNIKNIDSNAPTIANITITPDNNTWSREKYVQVNAEDKDSGIKGYYFGPKDDNSSCPTSPKSYLKESIKTYTEVGLYYACVMDNVGNISSKKFFNINNIDGYAPKINVTIDPNNEIWSKSKKVIAEVYEPRSGIKGYYFGPKDDNSSCPKSQSSYKEESTKKYYEIGNYKVCAIDNAGNISTRQFNISNIDRKNPNIKSITINPDNDIWSKAKEVQINAEDEESGIKGYYFGPKDDNSSCPTSPKSYKEGKTNKYNETGQYYACVMDNAGNISTKKFFNINNIDIYSPRINIIIDPNNETWSREKEVQLEVYEPRSGIKGYYFGSKDDNSSCPKSLSSYEEKSTKKYYEIGNYKVCARDNAGNISSKQFDINNIDRYSPDIDITIPKKNTWSKDKKVQVSANDNGYSGIKGYYFGILGNDSDCPTTPESYQESSTKTYGFNGKYYVCVMDNAGNKSAMSFQITTIDTGKPICTEGGSLAISGNTLTITPPTYKDLPSTNCSGISKIYYYVSENSTKPETSASGWNTNKEISNIKEGITYYVWSKAIDKVGNESDVHSLGSITNPKKCSKCVYIDSIKAWKCNGDVNGEECTADATSTGDCHLNSEKQWIQKYLYTCKYNGNTITCDPSYGHLSCTRSCPDGSEPYHTPDGWCCCNRHDHGYC